MKIGNDTKLAEFIENKIVKDKYSPEAALAAVTDSDVEFADYDGMERSTLHDGEKRTFLFYCHPYSSWERGSNENQNRLIRRHIPKGEDFDEKQDRDIEYIENWINNYPRGLFGFRTFA